MAKYSEEIKAAVMTALLTGQGVSQVANEYNIPRATVASWKKRGVAKNATQKKHNRIADLMEECLEETLTTVRAQAVAYRKTEWLHQQDAASAATLFGVMTDKAVRIIEAFGDAGDGEDY